MKNPPNQIKTTLSKNSRCKKRQNEIDLALAVMCVLQEPGVPVPRNVIAEVTGMSHQGPTHIEKTALKKIRNTLRFGALAEIWRETA